jgi:YaiO family outer membrane protein
MSRRLALVLFLVLGAAQGVQALDLELSYGHELLTGGLPAWSVASLEAAFTGADRTGARLALREIERFDRSDWEMAGALHAPLSQAWAVTVEASGSVTHESVPAVAAGASLGRKLGGGFAGSAGLRWSRFEPDGTARDVLVGALAAERYLGAHRLGWTGYVGTVAGSWGASQRIAWDRYYRDEDRFGVALAAGREIEFTGGPAPVVSRVLAATAGGRHGLAGGWALVYEIGVVRQGDLYTRMGGRIGVRRRF